MEPSTFVVADARTFDGDPYEVAERAIRQARAVQEIYLHCLTGAELMARNAEMERNLYHSDDPKAAEWEASPQGKRFQQLKDAAESHAKVLVLLEKAASFNPKKVK